MMKYSVKTIRAEGFEARWTRTSRGAPIIEVRNPNSTLAHQRDKWWYADSRMWETAQKRGFAEAFDCHTLLGNVFYL